MDADSRRGIAWFADSVAAFREDALASWLRDAGWQISLATQGEEADFAALPVLDMRSVVSPMLADVAGRVLTGRAGACVAILAAEQGEGEDISVPSLSDLTAAGVSHILYWPASDAVVRSTLDTAWACHQRLLQAARISDEAMVLSDDEDKDSHADLQPHVTPGGLDWLTGLTGRGAALHWLDRTLASMRQRKSKGAAQGGISACLLIGISQFDSVNAAYGKKAGDIVLLRVAERIRQCTVAAIGEEGLLARMGGTEYMVALPYKEGQDTEAMSRDLARLILSEVARPLVADDKLIRLTSRCGIAETAPEDDGRRLVRRAAAALADARRSGSSDIWFRPALRRDGLVHSDSDRLDADLRLALDRGEIGIVYQPQYDSINDQIIGVEALARWNHPELGQLDAGTLFAAADRSDYLLPLSLHIQRCALMEAGGWPEPLRKLRLAINITAVDLAQGDFPASLEGLVARSGFPADRLTVEITESGLIENIDRAGTILQMLRSKGIRVAIDDFGTGYSSLAYLKALHPDYLKIDHSLSRDIVGTARDRVILTAIIAMARSLALTVIAEGVESEEQLTLLARAGCDIYQGFLRSPAVSSADLLRLVDENGHIPVTSH